MRALVSGGIQKGAGSRTASGQTEVPKRTRPVNVLTVVLIYRKTQSEESESHYETPKSHITHGLEVRKNIDPLRGNVRGWGTTSRAVDDYV